MSDLFDGEQPGHYTVSVGGPMDEEDWTWQGYADGSVDALYQALTERGRLFRWKEGGGYERT